MRRALLLTALCGAFATAASANAATTVVYPTGQYPADVQNVQAAVDQGGTVLLKATNPAGVATSFNFGPPVRGRGFVDIERNTELVGERTSSAATTIQGGWGPVSGFGSNTVTVRDIDFRSPLDGAILFLSPSSANTEITGNRVFHVVGAFRSRRRTTGEAIVVAGGRVAIDDNVVESVDADNGSGISEFGSTGPVEVLRNRISGTTNHAIECGGPGTVRIEDNVLRPGPTLNGLPGYGIEVNGTGAYTIVHNDVVVESPSGIGIWAFGALGFSFGSVIDPVIARNHVVLKPVGTIGGMLFDDGIDLAGLVSGAYVGQNTIEGEGFSAFSLFALSFDPATQPSDLGFNTFVGNNIAHVNAGVADVFLDAPSHDTVFKGMSGSVIDLGVNNRVTGFTKGGSSGSGDQVSAAVHQRNDAMRDAAEDTTSRDRISR